MSCFRSAVAVAVLASLLARSVSAQAVPSPDQFFGFAMGAERTLASWDQIVQYFNVVDKASDRVLVQELGKSTMGKPYIMAIVSSPDTLANLAKYKDMQKKLADPRRTSEQEAARIAREGKVVLLIGTNVHATEIGNSQMVNTLVHKLATENSPWMDHVLRNVILLLIPSQNPDGQQMVVDWYRKNLDTPFEDSPTPELYHKYIGHDNNRDSYMLTQVETQHLTRVTYKEWLPEVYLDKHQMGSARARIFVPPFKNPPNPNIDPLVWSEVNLLGQAMAAKLHEAGKTGVIWGEQYTGFWQGANSTNPWWHNMVALLTETASSRMGTTINQEMADPNRPARRDTEPTRGGEPPADRDSSAPIAAPSDVQYRMNYTQPWLGGAWRLSDVVEYQLLSTLGLLEGVANNREMLKRNFYLMNRRTIDLYKQGNPFAFIVPAQQHDPIAAAKLLQLIQAGAGEVHKARKAFKADGGEYPEGSHVLLLAQPFGRWIKDLLEPQKYPDIRWPFANAPIDRPYDVAAWSLGMLMGVKTVAARQPFDADLAALTDDVQPVSGQISGRGSTLLIGHETNNSIIALNRLLKAGAEVSWLRGVVRSKGRTFAPGAILARQVPDGLAERLARDLHLPIEAVAEAPAHSGIMKLRAPRLAIFEPWGGNMDAGWTRWLLEQHEFSFTQVRNADLRTPNLITRFDVIIFAEMSPNQIVRGSQARNVRPEYRGGIGEEGIANLKQFVDSGGTVITLGNAAELAIQHLGVPFENVLAGLDRDTFFNPGSLMRIEIDVHHPVGFGMPAEASAMFINNGGYVPTPAFNSVSPSIIARYPQGTLLQSGWVVGEERLRGTAAVAETTIGKGRIIMHTFRVQSRAQSWGTFKLLFNSIFYGPAMAPEPAYSTSAERYQ